MDKHDEHLNLDVDQKSQLLEKKIHELYSIFDIVSQLKSSLNLDQIVNYTALTLMGHYGMGAVTVYLPIEENDMIMSLYFVNGISDEVANNISFNQNSILSRYLLAEDKPIYYKNLKKNIKPSDELGYLSNLKCEICIPLVVNKELRGIITLGDSLFPENNPEEDLNFLVVSSSLIAGSIENARYFKMAITDALTKIFTRRYFQIRYDEEFKRAHRYNGELSLLIIDINKFKTLNDTYGHHFGDIVLIKVAEKIKEALRSIDIPSRYGGDEFVVILPETGSKGAELTASRIADMVKYADYIHEGKKIAVSVSVGVASFPESGDTQEKLFAQADKDMYNRKKQSQAELQFKSERK